MNPIWSTILASGIPIAAVLIAIVCNELALKGLEACITGLGQRLDARIETLDRDLREWAKIACRTTPRLPASKIRPTWSSQ